MAVAPLEAIPDSEKDWHPGSNGFILNLVNPSLYPIVYGRTIGSDTPLALRPPKFRGINNKFQSKRFQWLPSDFTVDDWGKVTLTSPYINNVHPIHHKELYSIIPEILQLALPMFERVLSDLLRPLLPMRVTTSGGSEFGAEGVIGCIWENGIPNSNPPSESEGGSGSRYTSKFRLPDARNQYGGDLEVMNDRVSLKGRTLQVIVTLTNIVLTPERPEYPGGRWHVEGSL